MVEMQRKEGQKPNVCCFKILKTGLEEGTGFFMLFANCSHSQRDVSS